MKKLLARLFGKRRKQKPVERDPLLDFYSQELLEMACADSSRLKEIPPKKYNGEKVQWSKFTPLGTSAPEIDLVRCKDCKYKTRTSDGEYNPEDIVCGYHMSDGFDENDYCSYGEREAKNESQNT